MGTLYECLREARLEQFYPAFRANGITRSETLINLGMPEFCALGITGSEDKRRLVELVNIIKSVHESGISNSPPPIYRGSHSHGPHDQTSQASESEREPSHHRLFNSSTSGGRSEDSRDRSSRDRIPNFSAASYLDMLDSSESDSSEGPSDHEATPPAHANLSPSSANTLRASNSRGPVERIRHSKARGYNYGVHKVGTPKTRCSRSSASQRSFNAADERIKVCVRKRPLTRREQRAKDEDVVSVESTNMLTVNEPKVAVDLKAYTLQHEFVFDEVFDEDCSNQDVYIRAARPLISCVFNGGTAACFAYGQTGAGKTHTMLGNENVPGLYLLAGEDIFSIIESGRYGRGLHVWVSYFEIYCGQLFDLLNKRNRLHAREDGSRQVCIAGLTETEATDVVSLVQIMDYGNSVRSKGSTGVNPDSSRSHAVLQLDIRNTEDAKLGKISFIDLAGSERASDVTDTDRQTRMEGAEINQSLLALKECIRSIDQESRHTPFRQSKLTHILKDSFVGNSKTCMIANMSPTQSACENTLNTLRYADRVKELKKDSVRSSSVGQEMNLLMNIPPTAPSIFHPSNILSSSTPMRRGTASRIHRAHPDTDFDPDPSETPIRGHNMPRRHGNRDSGRQRSGQSQGQAESSHAGSQNFATSHKSPAVPRGSSSRSSSHATAASQGATDPPPDASPSESDHTDTDSCNVTNPTNLRSGAMGGRQLAVTKSTDTEFDFPTSDFNNLNDEINDLSRGIPSSEMPAQDAVNHREHAELRNPNRMYHDAAAASENVAMSVPNFTRKAPIVKPIVYTSVDVERQDEESDLVPQTSTNSTHGAGAQKFPNTNITSPQISQLPPVFNRLSSNEPVDHEEQHLGARVLPSSSSPANPRSPCLNITAQAGQRVGETERSGPKTKADGLILWNKSMMIPMPADSSDLTKFTQRPPLHNDFPHHHQGAMNDLSSNQIGFKTTVSALETSPPAGAQSKTPTEASPEFSIRQNSLTGDGDSTHSESATQINSKQRYLPEKLSVDQRHSTNHSLPISEESPVVVRMSPHPPSSPLPDTATQSPKCHSMGSGSEFRRRRRASHSPTGDFSDDSTDSIRASFSDQGQGATHKALESHKSSIRKERSDPMLALSIQRRKHTLPDPQNISKMLTRSNTPKSGLAQGSSGSGWKVTHNELPPSKVSHLSPRDEAGGKPCDHAQAHWSEAPAGNSDSAPDLSQAFCTVGASNVRPDVSDDYKSGGLPAPKQVGCQKGTKTKHLPELPVNSQSTNFIPSVNAPETSIKMSGSIITEKLASGAVFSPIHPQPVTSITSTPASHFASSIVSSSSSSSTVLQPKAVTASTASWIGGPADPSVQEVLIQAAEEARSQLVSAHEDQLASITSLCKYEMRLLLNAKKLSGKRGFDDYLRRVNDILQQKLEAIASLQEQIGQYQNTFSQGGQSFTSASASLSVSSSVRASTHSTWAAK